MVTPPDWRIPPASPSEGILSLGHHGTSLPRLLFTYRKLSEHGKKRRVHRQSHLWLWPCCGCGVLRHQGFLRSTHPSILPGIKATQGSQAHEFSRFHGMEKFPLCNGGWQELHLDRYRTEMPIGKGNNSQAIRSVCPNHASRTESRRRGKSALTSCWKLQVAAVLLCVVFRGDAVERLRSLNSFRTRSKSARSCSI